MTAVAVTATVSNATAATATTPAAAAVSNGYGLGRVVGVGIDIDQSALTAALGNAARAGLSEVCQWACLDFTQLADERVRQELERAVVGMCAEAAQSNDPTAPVKSNNDAVAQSNDVVETSEGLFDVILCNPPYLSAPSVRHLVTPFPHIYTHWMV